MLKRKVNGKMVAIRRNYGKNTKNKAIEVLPRTL